MASSTLRPPSLAPKPRVTMRPASGPSILVVDDDPMLRRALVRGLKRRYDVSERDDAELALAEIRSGARYDAIICDLTLGGMTGRQFLFALAAFDAELAARVIILTGAAKMTLDEPLLALIGDRFVEKPATLSEIDLVLDDVFAVQKAA